MDDKILKNSYLYYLETFCNWNFFALVRHETILQTISLSLSSSFFTLLPGKMYVCTICGKECLGKRRLQNHMVSKHPKVNTTQVFSLLKTEGAKAQLVVH